MASFNSCATHEETMRSKWDSRVHWKMNISEPEGQAGQELKYPKKWLQDYNGDLMALVRKWLSYKTILRRWHQYSMPVSWSENHVLRYFWLCDIVEEVCAVSDIRRRRNLRYWGTTKQGDKCSEVAYTLCDFCCRPSHRALRLCQAVVRRKYNVPSPNASW